MNELNNKEIMITEWVMVFNGLWIGLFPLFILGSYQLHLHVTTLPMYRATFFLNQFKPFDYKSSCLSPLSTL